MTADVVTILRARARRLAKTVRADGGINDFDRPKTFDLSEAPVSGVDGILALLCQLERQSDRCVVRGAVADPARTKAVQRLLRTGTPTLRDVPRRWLALDFDGSPQPDWIDPADLLNCACVAIEQLPLRFRRARFIVQATSGHGLKPTMRIRLWCWLSRPTFGAELKYWLRSVSGLDRSIFGAAQIIYTAAPIFLPGSFDPLPIRIDIMPGDDEVIVPAPSQLEPPKPRRRETDNQHDPADIGHLVHFVETAAAGNRNAALYWAACRAAEQHCTDNRTAKQLEDAAVQAGLSATEATATVRSAFRNG